MAKRFIQVVFITMPTPAPAGRRPRVRLRSTTIAYRNHRDDTKTRDAPPASPRSRVDGRGHAAGRSLPPPSPPRAPRFDIVRSRRRVASRRCSTGRRRKYFDAAVVGRPSVVRASLGRRRLRDRASSPTTFPDGIPFRRDPSSRSLPPPLVCGSIICNLAGYDGPPPPKSSVALRPRETRAVSPLLGRSAPIEKRAIPPARREGFCPSNGPCADAPSRKALPVPPS